MVERCPGCGHRFERRPEEASVATVVMPLLFYPFSKTIWCAIALAMHPPVVEEERWRRPR
jgi:hypothetical protein